MSEGPGNWQRNLYVNRDYRDNGNDRNLNLRRERDNRSLLFGMKKSESEQKNLNHDHIEKKEELKNMKMSKSFLKNSKDFKNVENTKDDNDNVMFSSKFTERTQKLEKEKDLKKISEDEKDLKKRLKKLEKLRIKAEEEKKKDLKKKIDLKDFDLNNIRKTEENQNPLDSKTLNLIDLGNTGRNYEEENNDLGY